MQKIKIVHVVESFSTGVLQVVADICNSLKDDYDFLVVYSERNETPDNFKDKFPDNTKFYRVNLNFSIGNIFEVLGNAMEVREILLDEKPHIIHAHSSKAGFIVRVLCVFRKCTIVYMPHAFSFLRRDLNFFTRSLFYCIEKICAYMCDKIVCVGLDELIEAERLRKDCGVLIYNKVELAGKVKEKNINVVSIGGIRKQKNFELFCDIAKRMRYMSFVWIGDGDYNKSSLPANVTVTGWMEKQSVLDLLQRSVVYISTSSWEGLPMSVIEAMSCRLPLVLTNCKGHRELVCNEYNGFFCENVDCFVDRISQLHADSFKARALGENSMHLTAIRHSPLMFKLQWNFFYRNLIS